MQPTQQRSRSGRVGRPKYNETRACAQTTAHLCYLIKSWKGAHASQRPIGAESRSIDTYLSFAANTFLLGERHNPSSC